MKGVLLQEFVQSAVARACNIDPAALNPQTQLSDIGLDSIALVAIVSQLETAYDLRMSAVDTLDLMTAVTLGELVEQLARSHAGPGARLTG
jgi:acyl carrier protein